MTEIQIWATDGRTIDLYIENHQTNQGISLEQTDTPSDQT